MSTITKEQQQSIADKVANVVLCKGLGREHEPCSIAAINLALTGELTDDIPDCMSRVIGRWVITIQDAMPRKVRNSAEWRLLLPLAAGTGRDHEQERLQIVLEWMWSEVLPTVQPSADRRGFGDAWRRMLAERTVFAAADAAGDAAAYDAVDCAADAAANAARVSNTGYAAGYAAADAADAAANADYASGPDFWPTVNPPALLRKLIEVSS